MLSEEKINAVNQAFNIYLETADKAGMDYRLVMQCTIAGLIDNSDCSKQELLTVVNEAIEISNRFTELKL